MEGNLAAFGSAGEEIFCLLLGLLRTMDTHDWFGVAVLVVTLILCNMIQWCIQEWNRFFNNILMYTAAALRVERVWRY